MTLELILRNGKVFDGENYQPHLTAVGITAGIIVAVGGDELLNQASATTTITDVRGGLIAPGFVDAHVHPIEGGLERMRCDLSGAATREEYLSVVGAYASAHPTADWILGGGWQLAAFPGGTPTAADLDGVVGDRPVYLPNRDHHGAWVNTRALALAGITRETPDPADGRIERDAEGNPTGTLHEGAVELVKRLVPEDTEEDKHVALMVAQEYLHSMGITGWQDALVGDFGGHTDTGAVYLAAAESGSLTARVVAALWWDRHRGLDQLPELQERRRQLVHPKFTAGTIKIMQDGIPENQTAALTEPYFADGCRCAATEIGLSFLSKAALNETVAALDADGWQVHIHAIGDRAVRDSLDAFEAAGTHRQENDRDNRHHIAHIQIVDPVDVPRFAALDVAVNMQALWATFDPQMVELNIPVLGEQRAAWQYPFGDVVASGARLAAGSDWPVSSPNPWLALHVAVNRTQAADSPEYNPTPFYPAQAITLAQALSAYTRHSTWLNHDDAAGRIAVGARADIVVTDRDPFADHPQNIAATQTQATYVGGVAVFQTSD